ncbi:MAG: hypothetical protein AB7V43_18170 [Acidimicrobiia bacterium]
MPPEPISTPLALLDLAERLGSLADIERHWFEVTSRWSADAVDPRAIRLLATLSVHHGSRFDLLVQRLPALNGQPPTAWLGRPAESPRLMDDPGGADDFSRIEHLAATVLSGLVAEAEALSADVDPRVDGPTHRVLRQYWQELMADLDAITAAR